ncbi:hypothetical protein HOA59_01725 [archaeon]|nr:hypothetical protein [archaeon]MBT6824135.1 hypothetical protein [archaeon]MBT7107021.1 hypothetical protein [archaeon]MBT7297633.1 hypothetical protein [archaeon]
MRNKKGFIFLTDEQLNIVIYVFLILFVFGVLIFISTFYMDRGVELSGLDTHLLVNGLLYSPDCLSYSDEVRSYPGIVDLDNFNENKIIKCLSYGSGGLGFGVELYDSEMNSLDNIEINSEIFVQGLLCDLKTSKYSCSSKKLYVLYENNSEFYSGYLNIRAVARNE